MRAWRVHDAGEPADVFVLEDVDEPTPEALASMGMSMGGWVPIEEAAHPAPDWAILDMRVAALALPDVTMARGTYPVPVPHPYISGQEGVGIVREASAGHAHLVGTARRRRVHPTVGQPRRRGGRGRDEPVRGAAGPERRGGRGVPHPRAHRVPRGVPAGAGRRGRDGARARRRRRARIGVRAARQGARRAGRRRGVERREGRALPRARRRRGRRHVRRGPRRGGAARHRRARRRRRRRPGAGRDGRGGALAARPRRPPRPVRPRRRAGTHRPALLRRQRDAGGRDARRLPTRDDARDVRRGRARAARDARRGHVPPDTERRRRRSTTCRPRSPRWPRAARSAAPSSASPPEPASTDCFGVVRRGCTPANDARTIAFSASGPVSRSS